MPSIDFNAIAASTPRETFSQVEQILETGNLKNLCKAAELCRLPVYKAPDVPEHVVQNMTTSQAKQWKEDTLRDTSLEPGDNTGWEFRWQDKVSNLLHTLTPEGMVEVQYRVPRTDGGILLGPIMGVSGQQMPVPLRGLLWPESTNVIFEASHHRILYQLAKVHLYNTTQDRIEEDFPALHRYIYHHESMIQATMATLKQRIKNWKCTKSFLELRKLYPLRQINMDENAEEMASFRVDRTLVEALFDLQIYHKQKPLIDCENLSAMWDDCDTCWKRLEERCMKHPPDGGEDGRVLHEIYQFAQKELSQLKDKGLKTGRGSVNHPLTNEKVTRSKNPTGYSEWDNPKGKTLSYVLGMYQTRQLMWARDFFRHYIDDFNAKCQDNRSQIPPGIPLHPSGRVHR